MEAAINIVLREDGPDIEFVDIERDDGHSIAIGERLYSGGYTKLRITVNDIKNLQGKS